MGEVLHKLHPNISLTIDTCLKSQAMGQSIGFVLIFSLFWFYPSKCQTEECCSTKVVNNSPDSSLDGTYTLASNGEKKEDICINGCVYAREGLEYCFISKPKAESADVVCEDGSTGSTGSAGSDGSATTQSLDSLSDAAGQAKDEADKASAEIAAADAAIDAANNAASELDKLDLSKFTSGSRIKRQNENNIIAPPGLNVQVDSSSETVTSSSAYPVPTTCAAVLTLMDEITDTLKNNPAGVTPLMTALSAIKTPLATPCSADDITTLTTKKNTAKSTADTAVGEQTKLKAAATEKYNTANDKLISLNEQIAAQGGSTIAAGTAAPTVATMSSGSGATGASGPVSGATTAAGSAAAGGQVCDFPKDVTGQLYTIPNIKTNEAGHWNLVFDKPKAGIIRLKVVDGPLILFGGCSDSSSNTATTECYGVGIREEPIPAGTYTLEVSSGDANAEGYTPWTTPPLLKTYIVYSLDKDTATDYCTPASGAVSGATSPIGSTGSAGSAGPTTT